MPAFDNPPPPPHPPPPPPPPPPHPHPPTPTPKSIFVNKINNNNDLAYVGYHAREMFQTYGIKCSWVIVDLLFESNEGVYFQAFIVH